MYDSCKGAVEVVRVKIISRRKDTEESTPRTEKGWSYQLCDHIHIWARAELLEERPHNWEEHRTLSEILLSSTDGHFSCFRIFSQNALQSNEVPSVLIRSFFTAILVDTPKLCCVISKRGTRKKEKRKEKIGGGFSFLWETSVRLFKAVHKSILFLFYFYPECF